MSQFLNYVNKACPYYMKEVFVYALQDRISSRNNYAKLKIPFRKTTMGQKSLSCIGPSVWNKFRSSMKRNISLNKSKHYVKKHYLRELRIYYYYRYYYHCYYHYYYYHYFPFITTIIVFINTTFFHK